MGFWGPTGPRNRSLILSYNRNYLSNYSCSVVCGAEASDRLAAVAVVEEGVYCSGCYVGSDGRNGGAFRRSGAESTPMKRSVALGTPPRRCRRCGIHRYIGVDCHRAVSETTERTETLRN